MTMNKYDFFATPEPCSGEEENLIHAMMDEFDSSAREMAKRRVATASRRKANKKHKANDHRKHSERVESRGAMLADKATWLNQQPVATRRQMEKVNDCLKRYEEEMEMELYGKSVVEELKNANEDLQKRLDESLAREKARCQVIANLNANMKGTEEAYTSALNLISDLRRQLADAKEELEKAIVDDDQRLIGISDSVHAEANRIFPVLGMDKETVCVDQGREWNAFLSTVDGVRNGEHYEVTFRTKVTYTTEMVGMDRILVVEEECPDFFPDCEDELVW